MTSTKSNFPRSQSTVASQTLFPKTADTAPIKRGPRNSLAVFGRSEILRLQSLSRTRCAETLEASLRSFLKFRKGIDLSLNQMEAGIMESYEAWMRQKGLSRNTSSFYMRNLRAAYRRAVELGLVVDRGPFRKVYTGIDKTAKRAITIAEVRALKDLNLSSKPSLELARDLFLFSFCARGMSFIDMALLSRRNIQGTYIVYRRRKTGQLLKIEIGGKSDADGPRAPGGVDPLLQFLTDPSLQNKIDPCLQCCPQGIFL